MSLFKDNIVGELEAGGESEVLWKDLRVQGVGKQSKWISYRRECVDQALGPAEIEEEAGEEGRREMGTG